MFAGVAHHEDTALYYCANVASCSEFFSDSEEDFVELEETVTEEESTWLEGENGICVPMFFCLLD